MGDFPPFKIQVYLDLTKNEPFNISLMEDSHGYR